MNGLILLTFLGKKVKKVTPMVCTLKEQFSVTMLMYFPYFQILLSSITHDYKSFVQQKQKENTALQTSGTESPKYLEIVSCRHLKKQEIDYCKMKKIYTVENNRGIIETYLIS